MSANNFEFHQSRSAGPGAASVSPPVLTDKSSNPRKKGRTACSRCKTRKQKCDDRLPVCSNCERAGAHCDKSEVSSEAPPIAYTRALEERVAQLEARLGETGSSLNNDTTRFNFNTHRATDGQPLDPSMRQHDASHHHHGHGGRETPPKGTNTLNDAVALVSFGNFEAPAYVGPSAGLSLAMNLREMLQTIPAHEGMLEDSDDSTPAHGMTSDDLANHTIQKPPSEALGMRLAKTYLARTHNKYPFLEPTQVWKINSTVREHGGSLSSGLSAATHFDIFKLYMVYAIAATQLHLTGSGNTSAYGEPERYYVTALYHLEAARLRRSVENVEAILLVAVYHLRSTSNQSIWYLIGLAMRTSIDLGLHRRGHEVGLTAAKIHRRRRLFWSVYSLERTIAVSLGRPVSISDRHIDLDFPDPKFTSSEPVPSPMSQDTPRATSTPRSQPSPNYDNVEFAVSLFQLRQIDSNILHSIYRADKPITALRSKLDELYQSLEQWRKSQLSSQSPSSSDQEYLASQYNRGLRLLLQPFLPLLTPEDPYWEICMRAAGNVCQAQKRLHQSLGYGHSFVAVQTVFMAGFTLLYGLWKAANDAWSVMLADDIRACSLVLFIMGERAAWVKKYRNAFELMVTATMERVSGNGQHNNSHAAAPAAGTTGATPLADTFMDQPIDQQPQMMGGGDFWELGADGNWMDGMMQDEGADGWRAMERMSDLMEQQEGLPFGMPDLEMLKYLCS